jgi:hypothetical protein
MFDFKWSPSEKKIAREAYDGAWEVAIGKLLAEFKTRANAAVSASDMWAVEAWLREQRKDMGEMFDYRYSQLPLVFDWAIRKGHMMKNALSACRKTNRRSSVRSSGCRRRTETSDVFVAWNAH